MPAERTGYVLDDDEAVLRSLERLLSSAHFEPVTFERPERFLNAAKTFRTGCVLLDVRLPGMNGLDVQAQLNRMRSDLSVIIVTAQGDVQTAVRAMKAGASDFLEKPYSDHALLGAIEATFEREHRMTSDREIVDAVRRVASLSPRERDVLDGLMAGLPVCGSPPHRVNAYAELGASRRQMMAQLKRPPPSNFRQCGLPVPSGSV